MTTELTKTIFKLAEHIPPGYVATYQGLAQAAGNPKLARRVGTLMKNSPPEVP